MPKKKKDENFLVQKHWIAFDSEEFISVFIKINSFRTNERKKEEKWKW